MLETNAKLVQTDVTIDQLTTIAVELSNSQKMCRQLESRIISVDTLRADSTKLKYYTGLPSNPHFDMVMKLIEPHIPVTVNSALSDQILLTLIKLRLNSDFKYLAYKFGVSFTSASSYFKCV
ncbi:unnamed protein product, partial [Callosobruchus maculatus]